MINQTFEFLSPVVKTALGAMGVAAAFSLANPAALAQETFNTQGINLDIDTIVEFEFLESNGHYQSIFGIINLDTGEKFPLYEEVKGSDRFQAVNVPSSYQDDLGLQNDDDFQGTPGNTVPEYLGEFRFEANTEYTFYLESYLNGTPAGVLYSTNGYNEGSLQYARFDGPLEDLIEGGLLLRWEDTGSLLVKPSDIDYDFDDFVVRIGGYLRWDQLNTPI